MEFANPKEIGGLPGNNIAWGLTGRRVMIACYSKEGGKKGLKTVEGRDKPDGVDATGRAGKEGWRRFFC